MNERIEGHDGRSPPTSSRLFEELFCSSAPLVPLAGALVTSSAPKSDVMKESYLGKMERSHRRYFVLRAGSHTGPSRLEWYKSREKFSATEKSSGKATMFGSNKQGVIYLRCCLGVSRAFNSRKSPTVTLYGKDQTAVLVAEDQQDQEDWYVAIRRLMAEEQAEEERGATEDDEGYCTLPPAAYFKEVWPVTVKSRGVGASKSLTGENRLCLTPTSLLLIRVGGGHHLHSVAIPLLSVRRFGHSDGLFFLELGRSAPNGPGEIWMEAREQGDPALAQHIHEAVREAVRALRVLPDFGRSPTSSIGQPQKRYRTKHRDKLGNARPIRPLALQPRSPDGRVRKSPTQSRRGDPKSSSPPGSSSRLSLARVQSKSTPESGGYVEMKMNAGEANLEQSWESVEEDDEGGLGYMIMSPQVSPSLPSASSLDDYVTMESPQRRSPPSHCSSSFDLQTSFNSSISDSDSPLHSSCDQIHEDIRLLWASRGPETETQQPKMAADSSLQYLEKPHSCPSPSNGGGFDKSPALMKALQARPDQQPGPHRSVRRYLFSSCLPSCFQADPE